MMDFFRTLFRPMPPSGTTAKERLRLVLLSDHLSLAPDVVEALKRDLLEVISRYVEIDPAHADVTFEQRESEVAMLANIPITGVRERVRPQAPVYAPPIAPEPVEAAELVDEQGEPIGSTHEQVVAEPARTGDAKPRRRRRRKKAPGARVPSSNGLATG